MVITMNKIAKILSVVLSASIALTVAVVTLVSALAADAPVFSLKKVSEDDTSYTVSIDLESGEFNNATFKISTSDKLTGCTKVAKSSMLMDIMGDSETVMTMTNKDTGKAVIISTDKLSQKGSYFVFTFAKASGAKVGTSDFTVVEEDINAKVENKVPAVVVPETTTKAPETTTKTPETTTEKVAETTTEAEVETTTEAEVETTTEAEIETTTEAEVETTTEAEIETTTEAEVETTTEAEVETTTEAEVETTTEAVVVNPNTGDSATASAAIVALLAISGAAVVALRKKED